MVHMKLICLHWIDKPQTAVLFGGTVEVWDYHYLGSVPLILRTVYYITHGVFHSHGGTPLSLDGLFHGKQEKCGGFLSHGGSPSYGWLIVENPKQKWMIFWGTPMTLESSISWKPKHDQRRLDDSFGDVKTEAHCGKAGQVLNIWFDICTYLYQHCFQQTKTQVQSALSASWMKSYCVERTEWDRPL